MADVLDQPVTATQFAHLVGVSQQAISVRVGEGLLVPGTSLRTWLQAYCEKLRTEAAGRSGDDQASLTRARTREAMASAELKELQIKEKAGELVPVAEIEPRLLSMVTAVRQELLSLPDKLAGELRALYGVDIDSALIETVIHDALQHLAGGEHRDDGSDVPSGAGGVRATASPDDD